MNMTRWIAVTAGLMAGAVAHGDLVYQSDFTGADLASAGLEQEKFDSNSNWIINTTDDRLQNDLANGNDRASVFTTDSWQSDGGFTLDVTFNQIAAGTRFSVGLLDVNSSINRDATLQDSGAASTYGIGFSIAGNFGAPDQLMSNFSGTRTTVSTAQGEIAFNTVQTLSLTVTPDSWSYSLNGATPTTGSFTFDTSRSYRFVAQAQRGTPSNRGSYFSNITLTAVPEPATAGLMGLGAGIVMLLRRRRTC